MPPPSATTPAWTPITRGQIIGDPTEGALIYLAQALRH